MNLNKLKQVFPDTASFKDDSSVLYFYVTLTADLFVGTYYELLNTVPTQMPPKTLMKGTTVLLSKWKDKSGHSWLVQENLDGKYHPICGVKVQFNDDDTLLKYLKNEKSNEQSNVGSTN